MENGYTFMGDNSVKMVLPPFRKGVYSKRKESAPFGSKFFLFRVDHFSDGDLCTAKQTGSLKTWLENQPVYSDSLS